MIHGSALQVTLLIKHSSGLKCCRRHTYHYLILMGRRNLFTTAALSTVLVPGLIYNIFLQLFLDVFK